MSENDNNRISGTPKTSYNDQEQEVLVEVEVSDEPPAFDDEASEIMADEETEFVEEDETDLNIVDMSTSVFSGHMQSVYCVRIHPSQPGVIISGGGDDRGFIWKYSTGNTEGGIEEMGKNIISFHELGGHSDTITAVGFNHDGSLAFTAGYDGVVKIWNVASGDLKASFDGPQDIEWAQWHNKGNGIVAGSSDGTAWMWVEMEGDWQCVQVFAGAHDGGITSGCFTTDGKYVCTGGQDGAIRVWAPKTGKCKQAFVGHQSHESEVSCMESSADGDLLLTGSLDGQVRLFQISGKRLLHKFTHSVPITTLSNHTPTDPLTESAPLDTSGTALPPPPAASTEDAEEEEGDMDVEDEDEEGGEEVLSVECVGFAGGVNAGKMVASGGMDKTLKIWDVVTGALRSTCSHGGGVVSLKWHSEFPLVTTAALDRVVRIWDARSGNCVKEFTGHTDLITSLHMARIHPNPHPSASSDSSSGSGGGGEGEADTDVIASVSDDGTVRVFHFRAQSLIS